MRFSCPGKVFIAGEYSCLTGGNALVTTIGPEFSLTLGPKSSPPSRPFAAQSPAGLLLDGTGSALSLEWHDPYETPIGVGSSSAQFLLTLAAISQMNDQPLPEAEDVLNLYWRTVGTTQGVRPSGVDVVAQWTGGPIVVRNEPFLTRQLAPWKGPAEFILAYTGSKAKTHEHLMSLSDRGFPSAFQATLGRLEKLTTQAIESWESSDASSLGDALTSYQHALSEGGLAPREFTNRLGSIGSQPGVLGCKGTGAQGGDCALLLVDRDRSSDVAGKLREMGWAPIFPQWTYQGIQNG